MAVRLRLLGSMDIDGADVSRLGSRKARLLLARLALNRGRPVTTDELTDALWSEGGAPARPADQLSVLVSRVRAVVGAERLPRTAAGYALRLDWLDIDAAAELVAEARRRLAAGSLATASSAAEAALALDRGPLLGDEADAPWLAADRASAWRTGLDAHQVAAEIALASGDPWAAIDHAARILAAEPYDEAALRVLMTGLARSGRPARALTAYTEFADRLRDELGVDPQPESAALHLSLLRGEPTAEPAAPHGRLAGRDLPLAMLAAGLTDAVAGRPVRVLVSGEAGIGKTRLLDAFVATVPASATVLRATGSEFGRRLALQPLFDAIAEHLRRLDPDELATILSGPSEPLTPFVVRSAVPDREPYNRAFAALADPSIGSALLLAALDAGLARIAAGRPLVLVIDDAHWLDATTVAWIGRIPHSLRDLPLLTVLASRAEEAIALPVDRTVHLGPLDLAAVATIVGADRAAELFARSGGHPLFLTELRQSTGSELPDSIRASVAERCERSGPAATTLRAAAVLGSDVDLELLAAVLGDAPAMLLDHLEEGVRRHLLVERETGFAFRHQLIQEALRAQTRPGRRRLLHRQAAWALHARGEQADPLAVAHHAVAGGDAPLAARAWADAGEAAAARFDHEEAMRHLSAAIELHDSAELRLRRARIALPAGHFLQADADASAALQAAPTAEAFEVAGIAAYLVRDLSRCRRLAEQGAATATDTAVAASCYALAGRAAHVTGDLADADALLTRAREIGVPATAALVSIWHAPLLIDQAKPAQALESLADATLVRIERHPFMLPHRHLVAAHAHAALGSAALALACLDAVDASAAGQRTPRFAARANNTRAFILRNLGALREAADRNTAAFDVSLGQAGMGEPIADALLGLADGHLRVGDLDAAEECLRRDVPSPWPFEWRHALRRRLLSGRVALARGRADEALARARSVLDAAVALPLPRYAVLARLLAFAARPSTYDDVAADVAALDDVAALESWWLTEDLARRCDAAELTTLARRRREQAAARAREAAIDSPLLVDA